MKKQNGFTLIELMIVVAIIGVLSAVAIPAYKNYVTKSELASAAATLKALVTQTELHIQEKNAFPTTLSSIGSSESAAQTLGLMESNQTSKDDFLNGNLKLTFASQTSVDGAVMKLTRTSDSGWKCTIIAPTNKTSAALGSKLPAGCEVGS